MGFVKKIWGWIKSGFKKLKELFKDKSPTEIIDDASKAVIGVATVAAVGYAGYNVVRSMFMRGRSRQKSGSRTGVDHMFEARDAGSIDEKIARARRYGRDRVGIYAGLSQEDVDLLEEVAKTRNVTFRTLTPAQQMNLLKLEGFDFEGFRKNMARRSSSIRRSSRRIGERSPENQTFRDPVDYGWLNFIARPLDDFLCWLKNDPTPKKVEQIHAIDRRAISDLKVASGDEMVETLRSLGSYLDAQNGTEAELESITDAQERAICAEEIFRHKSIKDYRRAVQNRMLYGEHGLSSQIFDLMDQDMKEDRKKRRKDDDDDDRQIHFYGEKKKGKKSKDKSDSRDADDYAAAVYQHFLKDAINGRESHRGYHLDRIFDET